MTIGGGGDAERLNVHVRVGRPWCTLIIKRTRGKDTQQLARGSSQDTRLVLKKVVDGVQLRGHSLGRPKAYAVGQLERDAHVAVRHVVVKGV